LAENAPGKPQLRAIIASHIPAATVSILSGLGVLALRADEETLARVSGAKTLTVPDHSAWGDQELSLQVDEEPLALDWLAVGPERDWASGE
jgi:hypothetical protein